MLDLKKIEERIDALLASETPESIRNWVASQNDANVSDYLGTGDFRNMPDLNFNLKVEIFYPQVNVWVPSNPNFNNTSNIEFAIAA